MPNSNPTDKADPFETARHAIRKFYPELFDAHAKEQSPIFLLCGSVAKGCATKTSDLDILIIQENPIVPTQRNSITLQKWPIEFFIHDGLNSLETFFKNDIKRGYPSLMSMCVEGVPIFEIKNSAFHLNILSRAQALLKKGPPILTLEDIDNQRYAISDLIDDLDDGRDHLEQISILSELFCKIIDFHLRSQNMWSGHGKALARLIQKNDPLLAKELEHAFTKAISGHSADFVKLCHDILAPYGGYLFDGYKRQSNSVTAEK